MAFILEKVVPWGRNFEEYRTMFRLTPEDLGGRIAGFGDGPASFNREAHERGLDVTSFDPIYEFSAEQLSGRIEETCRVVLEQTRQNMDHYHWTKIKNLEELEALRMGAMRLFLEDYEVGRAQGRYICHSLPDRLPVPDRAFDLGLSSHFLLMYTTLGYEFHLAAITEMLRACREVRIFPVCDIDSNESPLTERVAAYFGREHTVELVKTDYEFQKDGNRLMVIR